MPKKETLIESLSQQIGDPHRKTLLSFFTIELKYTYSQSNQKPETAKNCNINIKAMI